MCECADPYFTDELYYPQQSSGYPQSYPRKPLSDYGGCAILSGQAAKLAGEVTEQSFCSVTYEPLDVKSGTLDILRVEHLRAYYAPFAPEFRALAVCG